MSADARSARTADTTRPPPKPPPKPKKSHGCKELDDLVLAARSAGALGAKMAGTGRGGLMFAVCGDDEALQDKVFSALSAVAPQVWKTSFA